MSRALPARRVYHSWEDISTQPDLRLGAAFEETSPGSLPHLSFVDEDAITGEWLLPALGLFIGGLLFGRWWGKRKPTATAVVGGDVYESGLDVLGAA